MSRYAVIDFGSNTIRLCIYALPDVPSDSLTKKDITVLLSITRRWRASPLMSKMGS